MPLNGLELANGESILGRKFKSRFAFGKYCFTYYTTEVEACSLLDLDIWSNCAKFVVNFSINSCSIPVGKQDCCS